MSDSLNLVFQYFLAVGAGIGVGLVLTVGGSLLLYSKFKGGSLPWKKRRRA